MTDKKTILKCKKCGHTDCYYEFVELCYSEYSSGSESHHFSCPVCDNADYGEDGEITEFEEVK